MGARPASNIDDSPMYSCWVRDWCRLERQVSSVSVDDFFQWLIVIEYDNLSNSGG